MLEFNKSNCVLRYIAFTSDCLETAFSRDIETPVFESNIRGLLILIEELLIQIVDSGFELPKKARADEQSDPAPAIIK